MKKVYIYFEDTKTLSDAQILYFNSLLVDEGVYLYGKSVKNKFLIMLVHKKEVDRVKNFFNIYKRIEEDEFYLTTDFPFLTNDLIFEQIIVGLLTHIIKYAKLVKYWEKDEVSQNIFVERILLTVANEHEDGISHGYLSFLSNYLYYLSQLKVISNEEKYGSMKSKITDLSGFEEKAISEPLNIVNSFSKELKDISVKLLNNILIINLEVLPNPDKFHTNSVISLNYSEFHKFIFNNEVLIKRYKKDTFIIYRLLMGMVFKFLPILSISMNRRNHILYFLVKHVETYYETDWKKQIDESLKLEKKYVSEEN